MRAARRSCAGSAGEMSRMNGKQAGVGPGSTREQAGLTWRRRRARILQRPVCDQVARVGMYLHKLGGREGDGAFENNLRATRASPPATLQRQTISSLPSRLSSRRDRCNGQVGSMRSPAVRVTCPCRMRRWMFASTIRILRSSSGPLRLLSSSGEASCCAQLGKAIPSTQKYSEYFLPAPLVT